MAVYRPEHIVAMRKAIAGFSSLRPDWSGSSNDPPNAEACEAATVVADAFHANGLTPQNACPSECEGVCLWWSEDHLYADVEAHNCGDILAGTTNRLTMEVEVWDVKERGLAQTIIDIAKHLRLPLKSLITSTIE